MFLFKKKPKAVVSGATAQTLSIQTIPEVFYGGKDPLIYDLPGRYSHQKLTSSSLIEATGRKEHRSFTLPIKKSTALIVGLGLVVILSTIFFSWYYIKQAQPPKYPVVVAPPPQPKKPKIENTLPATSSVAVSTPTSSPVVVTTTTSLAPAPLLFPRILLTNSSDLDGDSLTDMEEEIFLTDSGIWDSDNDGYYDGQEVFNLYNPKGTPPDRLIDSGLIKEYVHQVWHYRVFYPATWEVGEVDNKGDQVLFSALSGDFIEIRAFAKKKLESFPEWFGSEVKGQQFTDLKPIVNRFKEEGLERKDSLVAYFYSDSAIFVLIYHPGTTGNIPFRHVIQMMKQSFRSKKTTIDIPEQVNISGTVTTSP